LKALFPDHGSQLTTTIVENHEIATAYDEAVQGVDAVIHMASPLPPLKRQVDNEKEILVPARDGAVNMLKSASKSSSVRRVVLTSSSAAVVDSGVPRSDPYLPLTLT
jgi:nucleoside-diphosphate-sugar epimerase